MKCILFSITPQSYSQSTSCWQEWIAERGGQPFPDNTKKWKADWKTFSL